MKRLAIIVMTALMLLTCASAEMLELERYPDYTGEPAANSARLIREIVTANDIKANIERFGALEKRTYAPDGQEMRLVSDDVVTCIDGVYVRQIIQDPALEIYVAADTAYMIENGAIYTMPAGEFPGAGDDIEDFLFVYDENEYVCGTREWEGGQAALTRTGDTWIEYFMNEELIIGTIKVYDGAENPKCGAYITLETCEIPEVPSFIIRESAK